MAATEEPVDEKEGYRPEVIQWWNSGEHMFPPPYAQSPAIDERLIHRYFSEMPFFDHASKNGLLLDQSMSNRDLFNITHDRHKFEDQLRRGKGVEFLVTGAPQKVIGGGSSGIYNMRKQDRKAGADGKEEIEVLGSYYFVGERVYQAPSMADVIENRMLSATTELSKFFEKMNGLASFSPTEGYTYLPADTSKAPVAGSSSVGTPSQSRAESVVPEPQSLRSSSVAPDNVSSTLSQPDRVRDMRILEDAFAMSIQFADEYMDENPLQGEPGNFTFTSSIAAVKKRKAEQEASAAKASKEREDMQAGGAVSSSRAASSTATPTRPAAPPAVMTTSKASTAATTKADKERKRKKKSRQAGVATPGSSMSGA
nr:mediator of rna polymerase ii transcription subunit 6 [Quercus suber]